VFLVPFLTAAASTRRAGVGPWRALPRGLGVAAPGPAGALALTSYAPSATKPLLLRLRRAEGRELRGKRYRVMPEMVALENVGAGRGLGFWGVSGGACVDLGLGAAERSSDASRAAAEFVSLLPRWRRPWERFAFGHLYLDVPVGAGRSDEVGAVVSRYGTAEEAADAAAAAYAPQEGV
jgi:hypothetical protein